MDAFYSWLANSSGLSPINTGLLLVVFILARQKINELVRTIEAFKRRIERNERTMIQHGLRLMELED